MVVCGLQQHTNSQTTSDIMMEQNNSTNHKKSN